jgi:hypothetical protein
MLVAGVSAYAAALGIHLTVGYTSLVHLLPAFAGLVIFLLGLGLSSAYLKEEISPNVLEQEQGGINNNPAPGRAAGAATGSGDR